MNRKQQTTLLIILTAATLMPAYSLQGWLASGHSANLLPFWFWIWETVAWSARALIEAGAILFLFETNAKTALQERTLQLFKVALIVLITATLGPVVASSGLQQSIPDALPRPLFWAWSFAIASYAPLMLGAVGFAYRLQPFDIANPLQTELQSDLPADTQLQTELSQPLQVVSHIANNVLQQDLQITRLQPEPLQSDLQLAILQSEPLQTDLPFANHKLDQVPTLQTDLPSLQDDELQQKLATILQSEDGLYIAIQELKSNGKTIKEMAKLLNCSESKIAHCKPKAKPVASNGNGVH